MPSVTPAGPISTAVDGLRTLLANVPWFQTWTGTANPTAALTHIFTGEVGLPIVTVSAIGGVVTISTREPHASNIGDTITIEGASLGPQSTVNIDGPQLVTAVTTTTISFTSTPAIADTGGALLPEMAFVTPCARPIAVIRSVKESLRSEAVGTGGAFISSGQIEFLVEADVSSSYINDPVNASYEAQNAVGQLLTGLMATQETGDLMFLSNAELLDGPTLTGRGDQNDTTKRFERWFAEIRVSWGLSG